MCESTLNWLCGCAAAISAECAASPLWYVGGGKAGLVRCTEAPGEAKGSYIRRLGNEIKKLVADVDVELPTKWTNKIVDSAVCT